MLVSKSGVVCVHGLINVNRYGNNIQKMTEKCFRLNKLGFNVKYSKAAKTDRLD